MEDYVQKLIAILIFGIMISLSFAVFGLVLFIDICRINNLKDPNYQYSISVNRTSEERVGSLLIEIAEGYNYSDIMNESPRDDGVNLVLKNTEGRAKFIYVDNLDHYIGRVRDLKEDHTYGHYDVEYTAEAMRFDEIELRLRSNHGHDYRSSGLYYGDDQVSFIEFMSSFFLYHNGTDLITKNRIGPPDPDVTYTQFYENCFLIKMRLDYTAYSKPDEGGGFILLQYVVLTEEGELKVMFNHRVDRGVPIHSIWE